VPITVTARSGEDLKEIRARAGNFAILGRIVARLLESAAQKAFLDQRLGDFMWPERYPSQEDPFVNIAALVNWTSNGGTILNRFFDRRPALMGTGDLMQSISGEVTGHEVSIGSKLPYAGIHQWGGRSTQPITPTAKKAIGDFIGEELGAGGKWHRKKRLGPRQKENREKYWFKLYWLLSRERLETEVNQRPFLGVTEEAEKSMVEDIEAYVASGDE